MMLTILREWKGAKSHWWVRARCSCGTIKDIRKDGIEHGLVVSCGCKKREACRKLGFDSAKHGQRSPTATTPEYVAWCGMIHRCENPNFRGYEYYGGRGIRVCKRWRSSFSNFFADMGRRPSPGHSIDRINNDGNYERGNCRWATRSEQNLNRRGYGEDKVSRRSGKGAATKHRGRDLQA